MWFFRKKKIQQENFARAVFIPFEIKSTKAQKKILDRYRDGNGSLAKSSEENYFHVSELVFSCVDYISKAASQATPKLYQIDKNGEKKVVRDKKLRDWIERPNPYWTWNDLIELITQGLLLSGGSYLTFELSKGVYESWFLSPPSKMKIVPHPTKYIEGYIYDDTIRYKETEVVYIKNPSLNNMYYGVPTVRPLLDTLLLEGYSIEELKRFYEGSNIITGVLQSEAPLTRQQIEELREQFNALYGKNGSERRGTAVLPGGLTYKPIQATPKDAMLLDSLNVTEKRVLRVFKLNALVLGGEASSTTHPQELMRVVFNTAVRPYLYKIASQMTLFLRRRFNNNSLVFEFDFDKIVELETSLDVKSAAARTLYATGIATLNEARDLVGLHKIDNPNANKNIVAAYLFGENATFLQDGESILPVGSDKEDVTGQESSNKKPMQGGAESTDPIGGTRDLSNPVKNFEKGDNE